MRGSWLGVVLVALLPEMGRAQTHCVSNGELFLHDPSVIKVREGNQDVFYGVSTGQGIPIRLIANWDYCCGPRPKENPLGWTRVYCRGDTGTQVTVTVTPGPARRFSHWATPTGERCALRSPGSTGGTVQATLDCPSVNATRGWTQCRQQCQAVFVP